MLKRVLGQKFQPIAWETLEGATWGAKKSGKRPFVCIVRCGTRLLDPDNLAASVKVLLDQLCYSLLIQGDTQNDIDLRIGQIKVSKEQIATYVRIEYPQ